MVMVVDSIMRSLVSPGEEKTQEVLKKADEFIEKRNKDKTAQKHPPRDNTGTFLIYSLNKN